MKLKVSERLLPGVSYKHASGWRLFVPFSLAGRNFGEASPATSISFGGTVLTLHHHRRVVTGCVPLSWLVDLNAPAACVEEPVDQVAQPELTFSS
jgi:hypothetical protein